MGGVRWSTPSAISGPRPTSVKRLGGTVHTLTLSQRGPAVAPAKIVLVRRRPGRTCDTPQVVVGPERGEVRSWSGVNTFGSYRGLQLCTKGPRRRPRDPKPPRGSGDRLLTTEFPFCQTPKKKKKKNFFQHRYPRRETFLPLPKTPYRPPLRTESVLPYQQGERHSPRHTGCGGPEFRLPASRPSLGNPRGPLVP